MQKGQGVTTHLESSNQTDYLKLNINTACMCPQPAQFSYIQVFFPQVDAVTIDVVDI